MREVKPITNPIQDFGDSITQHPVVLFDGVCNMCNGWVQFILKNEKNPNYKFASLQSENGRKLLDKYQIPNTLSSIVLIEDNIAYQKSDAVLRILKSLRFPWNIIHVFRFVPRVVRDQVYNWIASNRYAWFGKKKQCEIPSPAQRMRFIDF